MNILPHQSTGKRTPSKSPIILDKNQYEELCRYYEGIISNLQKEKEKSDIKKNNQDNKEDESKD